MDAISPAFRLSSEDDFRPIYYFRDWGVNEQARLVYYRPLRLLFVINWQLLCKGPITPLWLSATLRHACPGYDVPALPELSQLGKDAINAFVFASDLFLKWSQESSEEPSEAELLTYLQKDEDCPRLGNDPVESFVVTPDPDDDKDYVNYEDYFDDYKDFEDYVSPVRPEASPALLEDDGILF